MIQGVAFNGEPDTNPPMNKVAREEALELMLSTAPYTGDEFLARVARGLAQTFSVHGVYICELAFDCENAYPVIARLDEGAPDVESFSRGGPCDLVVNEGEAVHPRAVTTLYPDDTALSQLHAEAFIGTALRSDSADPIGVLFLLHRESLAASDFIKSVLELIAPRVGAELQRRQQTIALSRSEARLRFLAERSKDMMFYYQLAPTAGLQYVSPAVKDIFGYPAEAFHANPELVLEIIEPEERELVQNYLLSGSEEPVIVRIQRPDGRPRWVEYRDFAVRDRQQQLVGVGGTVRDLTVLIESEHKIKASEEYVRALLTAMPETVMRLSQDGRILDYVPGEVTVGQVNPAQVIGRNFRELLSLAVVGVLDRTIRAALRSNRPQNVEVEVPGEQHRLYEVRCLPFGGGEVLVVMRDLTAKRWQEGEEERQRLRDEIDYRVEHKTKSNPYALTYREMAVLHLVVEGMADKQIAEALGISIYTVNKHVGNILGKMNAVSRTEAGVRAVKEGLLGGEHP